MPKVSIIVPVYNAKKYLKDCIRSILNQSFQDFDLILVDDGSTDGSIELCKAYAGENARINLICKENGGISSVRNVGVNWAINNSDSDFILFIDSDDLIKNNLLEKVILSQEENNADIVCFGFEMVDDNLENLGWGSTQATDFETFSLDKRFLPLLPPYDYGDYVWNKLFKKTLFSNISFPEGMTFEDTHTTYKIFNNAKTVVLLPDRLYIYRRHDGSITTKGGAGAKSDFFEATRQKYYFISENYSKLSQNASAGIINSIAAILMQIPISDKSTEYKKLLFEIRDFILKTPCELKNNGLCNSEALIIIGKLERGVSTYRMYRRRKELNKKIKRRFNTTVGLVMSIKTRILRSKNIK